MFQPYLIQVHLELFGDQHRDGGVGALAHFDVGHDQHDLPALLIRMNALGANGDLLPHRPPQLKDLL
jgi:hypothetical protein